MQVLLLLVMRGQQHRQGRSRQAPPDFDAEFFLRFLLQDRHRILLLHSLLLALGVELLDLRNEDEAQYRRAGDEDDGDDDDVLQVDVASDNAVDGDSDHPNLDDGQQRARDPKTFGELGRDAPAFVCLNERNKGKHQVHSHQDASVNDGVGRCAPPDHVRLFQDQDFVGIDPFVFILELELELQWVHDGPQQQNHDVHPQNEQEWDKDVLDLHLDPLVGELAAEDLVDSPGLGEQRHEGDDEAHAVPPYRRHAGNVGRHDVEVVVEAEEDERAPHDGDACTEHVQKVRLRCQDDSILPVARHPNGHVQGDEDGDDPQRPADGADDVINSHAFAPGGLERVDGFRVPNRDGNAIFVTLQVCVGGQRILLLHHASPLRFDLTGNRLSPS
mmetsp:Transcript_23795/g.67283  ORF Transcript_23795/g.67283 Transcript_23795/m.67283 type:complete len:387 (-) Transcript_23795:1852-3012(-)